MEDGNDTAIRTKIVAIGGLIFLTLLRCAVNHVKCVCIFVQTHVLCFVVSLGLVTLSTIR